ncbi:MAG: 3-deoxy-manno-octulosonate cytidylyltransferase [Candidatus Kapabacteria bacterium]|nr:3-deoxy-manno-octulosonate cytidylyltransferase [Candidatus Kapabacteria bacterium]
MSFLKERIMDAIGIIPARIGSVRLPEKPLALINGKSLIQRVWEGASTAKTLRRLIVATDDIRIKEHCESFGAEVVLTPAELPSGTDRIAYVVKELDETADVIFNIQGDEPLIKGELIDELFNRFVISLCEVGTLIKRINDVEELDNPGIVKVTLKNDNVANYFSRSPIPFVRDKEKKDWLSSQVFWKHIGIYAYKDFALKKFTELPQTDLEISESLEQLRLLQNNFKFFCLETKTDFISIDTPEDILKVEAKLNSLGFD